MNMPVAEQINMGIEAKIHDLDEKRARLMEGGGKERIEKQHQAGKLTARERIDRLVDGASFQEIGLFARHHATLFGMADKKLPADGFVTGAATVDGRLIHLASQDFTVGGGAAGEVHSEKVAEMMRYSLKTGSPLVFINHAGGAAYSPALTDFIIQTKGAQMFITGPSVIKQVTGEVVTPEELGGPAAQMTYSGVVHFIAENDEEAAFICRRLLSFLPSNNLEDPPRLAYDGPLDPDPSLNTLVPDEGKVAYDMRSVIAALLDQSDFLEVQLSFAQNILVGFGRIAGRTVGVIANQPSVMAGALDINASDKAARFIRFCNAFNIPLLTLVDVPGFMPGVQQEYGGIIRHGAKLLFAYSAATVPKVTVIVRKAYGGAYLAMCGKDLGADRVVAWPTAEIAVMGAEGAVEVVFRREIHEGIDKNANKERRKELIDLYRNTFSNPYVAGGARLVDDIIEPAQTRRYLAMALEALQTKRELRPAKKHGLMPL